MRMRKLYVKQNLVFVKHWKYRDHIIARAKGLKLILVVYNIAFLLFANMLHYIESILVCHLDNYQTNQTLLILSCLPGCNKYYLYVDKPSNYF